VAIPSDPNQSSSHNFGFLTRIKYGGPLGKITAVGACFFITLLAIVAASRGNPYVLGGTLLIAFVSLLFVVSQIRHIFTANPELSTLEGREVLEYRKTELKFKHTAAMPVVEITTDPELQDPSTTLLSSQSTDDEEDE